MKPTENSKFRRIGVVAEVVSSEKTILILRPKDGSTNRAENYLRSRGWDVRVVLTVKEALTTISLPDFNPGFAILPVDHAEKNVTMLPGVIKQKFGATIIAVFNRVPNNSAAILEKFKTQYALTSPVSGPSIERIVSKIKLEGDAATTAKTETEKIPRDKQELMRETARETDAARVENKRDDKITIAGQKSRRQEKEAPIQLSSGGGIKFNQPRSTDKRVPLIYQPGNRGSLLRAVQEEPAPKPPRRRRKKKRETGLEYDIFDAWAGEEEDEWEDVPDEPEPSAAAASTPSTSKESSVAESGNAGSPMSASGLGALDPSYEGPSGTEPENRDAANNAEAPRSNSLDSLAMSEALRAKAASQAANQIGALFAALPATGASSGGIDPKVNASGLALFERAVIHALEVALTDEDAVEFNDDIARHCCLAVRSTFATGYVLFVQDGSYQSFGAKKFVTRLRDELVKFMLAHGQSAESESFAGLRLVAVEADEWARREATVLSRGFAQNTHVVIGFFPSRDTNVESTDTTRPDLRQISLRDFDGDAIVEFDLLLHLPVNGKFIRYTPPGGRFLSEQKTRLETRGVEHLFIKKDQIGSLTKYRAQNFLNERISAYLASIADESKKKRG